MKNKIIIILISIILIYILYVCTDLIRLNNNKFKEAKPLITLNEKLLENDNITYQGLGYSVTYYRDIIKESDDLVNIKIYGMELKIFNKIIYSYVE